MSVTTNTAKAVGWSAGAVAIIGALAAAFVQVRASWTDAIDRRNARELAEYAWMVDELGRHATDEPTHKLIYGDAAHGVAVAMAYGSTCLARASAGRLEFLASPEHRAIVAARPFAAGFVGAQCRAPLGHCGADPATHQAFDYSEIADSTPDAAGYFRVRLVWQHGCQQAARWHPNGDLQRGAFECCAH